MTPYCFLIILILISLWNALKKDFRCRLFQPDWGGVPRWLAFDPRDLIEMESRCSRCSRCRSGEQLYRSSYRGAAQFSSTRTSVATGSLWRLSSPLFPLPVSLPSSFSITLFSCQWKMNQTVHQWRVSLSCSLLLRDFFFLRINTSADGANWGCPIRRCNRCYHCHCCHRCHWRLRWVVGNCPLFYDDCTVSCWKNIFEGGGGVFGLRDLTVDWT